MCKFCGARHVVCCGRFVVCGVRCGAQCGVRCAARSFHYAAGGMYALRAFSALLETDEFRALAVCGVACTSALFAARVCSGAFARACARVRFCACVAVQAGASHLRARSAWFVQARAHVSEMSASVCLRSGLCRVCVWACARACICAGICVHVGAVSVPMSGVLSWCVHMRQLLPVRMHMRIQVVFAAVVSVSGPVVLGTRSARGCVWRCVSACSFRCVCVRACLCGACAHMYVPSCTRYSVCGRVWHNA
jgi:hypothetical protein